MPTTELAAVDPEPPSRPRHAGAKFRAAWPWVMAVVGLDYFSSLAYQPSVAFSAAGNLAPVVTVGVVAMTLLFAMPLYWYLAGRSPNGTGSTGLLERLIPGWVGKFLVLTVLGFAATDLVFTRTFSAANAAEHLIHSPFLPWQRTLAEACAQCDELAGTLPDGVAGHTYGMNKRQLVVTLILLLAGSAVAFLFRRGITRGLLRFAVVSVAAYLIMTGVIVGSGVGYLVAQPDLVEAWWRHVEPAATGPDWTWQSLVATWWPVVAVCVVLFPKMALGMSGYELALTTMPLVKGDKADTAANPRGRIRNTRIMLAMIAIVMSVYLLSSTLVTTILIPEIAFKTDGQAENRALAYLAHGGKLVDGTTSQMLNPIFGEQFGAAYDVVTITVLTLAGITVLIGMRELIPPYLYRLGMDWKWSQRMGLLMYLFTFLKLAVAYFYSANLDAQRGAYLTGVLSIFTMASFTALIDVWKRRQGWWTVFRVSPVFLLAFLAFAGSTIVVVRTTPTGLFMTLWFVGAILAVSMVTRFFRNHELRFNGFEYANEQSRFIWEGVIGHDFPIIVPVRPNGSSFVAKEKEMRVYHRLPSELDVVFIKVELGDASDFYQRPLLEVTQEEGHVVAHITGCSSIPHAIAAAAMDVAKQGMVPEVHFGWSGDNPLTANLNFVLFGHGNVPWMVYELIQAADFPADRKPRVMVG